MSDKAINKVTGDNLNHNKIKYLKTNKKIREFDFTVIKLSTIRKECEKKY